MRKFKLIEGEFTIAEAKELVVSLLEHKIQFHNRENFSTEIRKGYSDEQSLKRKHELIYTKEEFLKYVSDKSDDEVIAISAEIMVV